VNGETEASDFWANHGHVLREAWKEWEAQQELPPLHIKDLLNQTLRNAVQAAWKDSSKENQVKKLWRQVAPNVYKTQFLDPQSIHTIRKHIDAASYESKIPTRRPNGMNRYGLILHPLTDGSVVLGEFEVFFQELLQTYIRPMARALFSEYISKKNEDDIESYAFTIRYQKGQDLALNEHSDASLYTLNVNLNLPNESYKGSSLYFVDDDGSKHNVSVDAGEALLHVGMARHAALPIQGGHGPTW
jgi:hypothetical protein